MLDPKEINIGNTLIHNKKGEIIVLGIHPHCDDYCVTTEDGWVYLKNCNKK